MVLQNVVHNVFLLFVFFINSSPHSINIYLWNLKCIIVTIPERFNRLKCFKDSSPFIQLIYCGVREIFLLFVDVLRSVVVSIRHRKKHGVADLEDLDICGAICLQWISLAFKKSILFFFSFFLEFFPPRSVNIERDKHHKKMKDNSNICTFCLSFYIYRYKVILSDICRVPVLQTIYIDRFHRLLFILLVVLYVKMFSFYFLKEWESYINRLNQNLLHRFLKTHAMP